MELIKVSVRLRPLLKPYEDQEAWSISPSSHSIMSLPLSQSLPPPSLTDRDLRRTYSDTFQPQQFLFDYVYGPEACSQEIYQQLCRPIIHSVLSGYNGTVFMYGQTTSGKTYTMLGTPEEPGVLPCTVKDVFQNISNDLDHSYTVWVSYFEIYNEQIHDLLSPHSASLKVKDDPRLGITISGLKQQQVWSFDQVLILLNYGEEHRTYRETNIHEHSSRSHTIFKVTVESETKGRVRYGGLHLVDLAGSERLGEFEMRGQEQMEETGHINKSLFVLTHVINKLTEGRKQHIPYRDSKLTRVLSQALGGNSLTAIVCTVSPAAMNFYQTLSTLRFATRAKTVRNKPVLNEVLDEAATLAEYKSEVSKLRSELKSSSTDILSLEKSNLDLRHQLHALQSQLHTSLTHSSEVTSQYKQDHSRLLSLQHSLEHQHTEHSLTYSQLSQQYQDLLLTLTEEKAKRSKFERELNAYKTALKEVFASQRGTLESLNRIVSSNGGTPVELPLVTRKGENREMEEFDVEEIREKIRKKECFGHFQTDFSSILNDYLLVPPSSSPSPTITDHLHTHYTSLDSSISHHFHSIHRSLDEYYQLLISNFHGNRIELETIKERYKSEINALEDEYRSCKKRLEMGYFDAIREVEMKENRGNLREKEGNEDLCAYFWGSGKDGRLGMGSEENRDRPERVLTEFRLKTVVCGYHHSAAISKDGGLYMWGRGVFGQLGQGNTESEMRPMQVTSLSALKVTQVSCGWNHSLAVTDTGSVFSWGYGEDGQLGHGELKDELVPRHITQLRDVGEVACGHSHSACVSHTGVAYFWGLASESRLFHPSTTPVSSPTPHHFPCSVRAISLGVSHSGVITTDGSVYTSGTASDGQLGISSLTPSNECVQVPGFGQNRPVQTVTCGDCYTILLTGKGYIASGEVFSFGKGTHGRLGLGDTESRTSPTVVRLPRCRYVSAGCRHAAAVTMEGEVYVWGFNFYDQLGLGAQVKEVLRPTKVPLPPVLSISCGYFHTGATVAPSS